ncbi:MAG: phosphatidate cytidylyltransferase [Deltaproteobacteria bacterium]|nr:phosphatidate cytidylyltransferase [Deltaproteobacteria bacterium]
MLKQRIIAGVLAGVALLALLYLGSFFLMLLTVLVFSIFAYLEYDKLFFQNASTVRRMRLAAMITLGILSLDQGGNMGWYWLWLTFIALSIWHIVALDHDGDFGSGIHRFALEFFGYVYVIALMGFLVPIARVPTHGREYLLLLFLMVFIGDTSAYFAGMRFGKHPLAPKLSPKKTIEGASAGMAASIIASVAWYQFIYTGPHVPGFAVPLFLFVPLGSALAQAGDLLESLLKRSQSQKDSGSFLPGHGGLLDRIDGLALVSPVFYFFIQLVLEHP